ncbi:hypothetical protein LCGC14_2316330 [marine sediment metagenome]|uniref:Uncharacterized protein n=1 Tax=marine sediment metagenome TaxID=412755 RepID=A0A0F9D6N6_9ZZZZ
MNNREIILNSMHVNQDYMRLPVGKVAGLEAMIDLYRRIASQSLDCARDWMQDLPCPYHEPATDAFIWGIVAWADAFGLSMGVDMAEWSRLFVYPHDQFANYLRPGNPPSPLEPVNGSPANVILTLDAAWTELVIKLTAQWGLLHHFKDHGAMIEAQRLQGELHNLDSPTSKAFLKSDLTFFRHLFKSFPFSEKTQKYINAWLKRAEEGL